MSARKQGVTRESVPAGQTGLVLPAAVRIRPEAEPVVASRYGTRDYWARRLLAGADVLALIAALLVTTMAPSGRTDDLSFVLIGAPFTLVALPIFRAYGLYDRDARRISHGTVDDLPAIFHSLVVFGLLQWAYFRIAPTHQLVLVEVLCLALSAGAFLMVLRSLMRLALEKKMGSERVIIVGSGPSARALMRKMRAHPEYGVYPAAILREDAGGTLLRDVPLDHRRRFGRAIDDRPVALGELASSERAERIVLSLDDLEEATVLDAIFLARRMQIKVSLLPKVGDALGASVETDEVEGMTLLALNPPVLSRSSRMLKRGLDLAGAGLGLIVLLPVFAIVAIAISLDSSGPVLFRQSRVGKRGERFRLLKFRTMVPEAESRREQLLALSVDADWLHLEHDPRITRAGRTLRRLSVDELPQLWNVLVGHMSLVGPRPLIEDEDRLVDGFARHRLDLTPGMTGLWQVLGRTRIPFEEMIKLDYLYVTNWSLWGDVRLLLKTIGVVVSRNGAN